MESFERLAPLQTRVLRGGEVSSVEARQLVQGDTALMSGGDKVPADLQILEAASLKVSMYTSGPLEKNKWVAIQLNPFCSTAASSGARIEKLADQTTNEDKSLSYFCGITTNRMIVLLRQISRDFPILLEPQEKLTP